MLATLQRQVAETRGKIVNEQARLQELRCQRQELADLYVSCLFIWMTFTTVERS